MPFGKHRGTPLEELPDSYITWLLTEFRDRLFDNLKHALEEEAENRGMDIDGNFTYAGGGSNSNGGYQRQQRQQRQQAPPPPPPPAGRIQLTAAEKDMASLLVQAGYRSLAKKYHTDIGGKEEDMKCLDETVAKLRKVLG